MSLFKKIKKKSIMLEQEAINFDEVAKKFPTLMEKQVNYAKNLSFDKEITLNTLLLSMAIGNVFFPLKDKDDARVVETEFYCIGVDKSNSNVEIAVALLEDGLSVDNIYMENLLKKYFDRMGIETFKIEYERMEDYSDCFSTSNIDELPF